jgi:hypothetical protein
MVMHPCGQYLPATIIYTVHAPNKCKILVGVALIGKFVLDIAT